LKKQSQFNGGKQNTGERSQKKKIENEANLKLGNLAKAPL